jgi:Ca2+-dependent lipid-binding protein
MMDCELVFEPFDDSALSKKSKMFTNKRNSKIELVAKLGKGVASIPIPVLLTEVGFRGTVCIKYAYSQFHNQLRVQIKFCTVFPHIEVI